MYRSLFLLAACFATFYIQYHGVRHREVAAEQAWDIALLIPAQKQSFLSQSSSADLLLPETLMWRGIYQAGAQIPNSLPSGSVNCAHLPQGSVLSSWERVTPRALSVLHVSSILSVCKT
jgi:hypothetical protein